MTTPYPLRFVPILKEKVWGGRRLEKLGKALPPQVGVGESWELADLGATSPGGGGGDAARSVIANGPLAGQTLHDAMKAWGARLMGKAAPTPVGNFPLLVKFLDAREHLSVQVHPSPEYVRTHPEAHLKTECWTVIDAQPGSKLFVGLKPGLTPEALASHINDGSVADDLIAIEARIGDTHLLPSGTCHALGAGILVAEVQTPSDTTFRVYDWTREYGRPQRELHIEQALACIDFGNAPAPSRLDDHAPEGRIVTTEFFTLDQIRMSCQVRPVASNDTQRPVVLIVLSGQGEIRDEANRYAPVTFEPGATLLLPAELVPTCQIAAGPGTNLLRATLV